MNFFLHNASIEKLTEMKSELVSKIQTSKDFFFIYGWQKQIEQIDDLLEEKQIDNES